ncbi:DUF4062 domain-containing protein [Paenibacillus sp. PAMC21692]|uniref:DUF4062 domain-containing protein n=1 Tax=Paenibacillus sp. PAMC21692 TaxID=2762320 RepID=UPI00164DC584|nr:DUF4062 domain-containing protein [Paenibacillus sp. PAMC21692]QNK55153.1 DUF4062 domain-containing protein [Paenibacillus sp. PAMC21692]
MKPRIFVSSTYYDLKHIRNNVERFVNQYGFEPVLFESGNVFFEHDKELDISCYNEVKLCHMMVLIIGGRYGAPTSEEKQNDFVKKYEKNYISITRKEFREAVDNNIPIYIFVEKNVYSEYHTFKKNKKIILDILKNPESNFRFAYVDSPNVFDFIDEVKVKAITTFEKFEEIEVYLRSQWAGMFYNYIIELIKEKDKNKIIDEVSELHNISERMNEMINQIGKSILTESGEYEDVVKRQNEKTILFYTNKIIENLKFSNIFIFDDKEEGKIFEVTEHFVDIVLNNAQVYDQNGVFLDTDFIFSDLEEEIGNSINKAFKDINDSLHFESINLYNIYDIYSSKLKPLFDNNGLESLFKETLEELFGKNLIAPF